MSRDRGKRPGDGADRDVEEASGWDPGGKPGGTSTSSLVYGRIPFMPSASSTVVQRKARFVNPAVLEQDRRDREVREDALFDFSHAYIDERGKDAVERAPAAAPGVERAPRVDTGEDSRDDSARVSNLLQMPVQRRAAPSIDAPRADSLRADRATIDGERDEAGGAPAPGELDAPAADSIRADRATIAADAAAGPLTPARAARAAAMNPARAAKHGIGPADLGTDAAPDTGAFAQAVATLQAEHGLTVDGIVGPKTAAAVRGGASPNSPGGDPAATDARGDGSSLLQMKAGPSAASEDDVHRAAAAGIAGSAQPLPHLDRIQAAFGAHDVSTIQAHVGGPAAIASDAIGAEAYATGHHVAFNQSPDLHTAAHEAAHVVQQRAGVHLKGGVGQAGDTYEQHADTVADAVVRGESAEALLGSAGGGASTRGGQRKGAAGAVDIAALRVQVRDQVDLWDRDATDALRDHRRWLQENWDFYLSRTSSNPRISTASVPSASLLRALAQNALSGAVADTGKHVVGKMRSRPAANATGSIAKTIVSKVSGGGTGAAIGSVGGPVGAAFGFVIGVFVETAAGILFDWVVGDQSMKAALAEAYDQGLADGGIAARQQARAKIEEIEQRTDDATEVLRRQIAEHKGAIEGSSDPDELQRLAEQARAASAEATSAASALAKGNPLALAQAMLELWVRDHAGGTDRADGDANNAQWKRVTAELAAAGDNRRFAPGRLMNQPDLFIVQTAHHWESLGVPHAASLRAELESQLALDDGPLRNDPLAAKVKSAQAAKRFSGKQFVWEQGIQSERFSAGLPHADGARLPFASCTMTLREENGSCVVAQWDYVMRTESGQMLNARRTPTSDRWTHTRHGPLSQMANGQRFPEWEQARILGGIAKLQGRGLAVVEEAGAESWLEKLGQDTAPTIVHAGRNEPVRVFRVASPLPWEGGALGGVVVPEIHALLREDLGQYLPQRVGDAFVLRGGNVVLIVPYVDAPGWARKERR